jgi:hypothetical protein
LRSVFAAFAVPIGHGKAANYAPVDKRNWNWDVFLKILHTWLWWACHQLLLFHCADVCLSCNFTALRPRQSHKLGSGGRKQLELWCFAQTFAHLTVGRLS